ncbi:MAG: lactonase family protein [Verrucomicrobiota bacterium]
MKNSTILAILAASTLSLTACAHNTRVYFGTGKGIYFADLDSVEGTLSEAQLAITLENSGFIVVHPNKKFIYSTSATNGTGAVAAMKINEDGTLSLLNKQSSEGDNPCHVSLDASGQMLMTANYSSGSVASFRIQEDGSLSKAKSTHQHEGSGSDPSRQQKPRAHSIFPNPENTFAYAPDLGIDKVMIYKLDPKEGTLSAAGFAGIPGGRMGPRHMKWSANGQYAYVLNEPDSSISVFRPGKTSGSLEFIETRSTLPEGKDKTRMFCAEIRIHPNGRFIYASNRDSTRQGRDSISVFSRFEDDFQRLETTPVQVWYPRNFNIDPSGKWLIVGGQKSRDIALFKINPETGALEHTGRKIPFNGDPICIEFLD